MSVPQKKALPFGTFDIFQLFFLGLLGSCPVFLLAG